MGIFQPKSGTTWLIFLYKYVPFLMVDQVHLRFDHTLDHNDTAAAVLGSDYYSTFFSFFFAKFILNGNKNLMTESLFVLLSQCICSVNCR